MNFLNRLRSFIFPETCGICNHVGNSFLCEKCKNKLENSKLFINTVSKTTKDKTKYFDEQAYIFVYDSIIREKIIQYKFKDKAYLGKMFSEFFVKNEKICGFLKKYDIIIPVPMTYKKIKERGYNQTELISILVAKNIKSLTFRNDILVKYKENKVQSKLTKLQRIENVRDVYKINNKEAVKGKNILILDDVYTTGSTCNECARILKTAFPNKIGVITIAKDYEKIYRENFRKDGNKWKI